MAATLKGARRTTIQTARWRRRTPFGLTGTEKADEEATWLEQHGIAEMDVLLLSLSLSLLPLHIANASTEDEDGARRQGCSTSLGRRRAEQVNGRRPEATRNAISVVIQSRLERGGHWWRCFQRRW